MDIRSILFLVLLGGFITISFSPPFRRSGVAVHKGNAFLMFIVALASAMISASFLFIISQETGNDEFLKWPAMGSFIIAVYRSVISANFFMNAFMKKTTNRLRFRQKESTFLF